MTRIHNFSAGPAVLPVSVLQQTAKAVVEYQDTGLGVLEMSHRSQPFEDILDSLQSRLRSLLDIPIDYTILVCTGGATQQFSVVPLNLLGGKTGGYILSGSWSEKAEAEARRFGNTVVLGSSKENSFRSLPAWNIPESSDLSYIHFTSNNTIYGTQFKAEPDTGDIPLVCDASSDLLHRRIDVRKYGLIYASTQKNLGPAGATIVIVRNDLLEREKGTLPIMLDYTTYSSTNSLYNTPPTGVIYMTERVLAWIEEEGGLGVIAERNQRKAEHVYRVIDDDDFYQGHAERDARSIMNVTFTLTNRELEKQFLAEAEARGMSGLKGHRSLGGMRASMYNALPEQAAQDLAEFMRDFRDRHV